MALEGGRDRANDTDDSKNCSVVYDIVLESRSMGHRTTRMLATVFSGDGQRIKAGQMRASAASLWPHEVRNKVTKC